MKRGIVYFMDGSTENIITVTKLPYDIVKIETSKAEYIYKKPHPISAVDILTKMLDKKGIYHTTEWYGPIYYKHIQEMKNDEVIDKYIKVPIDRIKIFRLSEMNIDTKKSKIPQLKTIMTARQMSIKEVAHVTGIKEDMLIKYIDGDVRPRNNTIENIADSLGISPLDLVADHYIAKELLLNKEIDRNTKRIDIRY